MRTALRGQANLELGETAKQNGALEAERGHAADSSPEASPLPPLGRTQSRRTDVRGRGGGALRRHRPRALGGALCLRATAGGRGGDGGREARSWTRVSQGACRPFVYTAALESRAVSRRRLARLFAHGRFQRVLTGLRDEGLGKARGVSKPPPRGPARSHRVAGGLPA